MVHKFFTWMNVMTWIAWGNIVEPVNLKTKKHNIFCYLSTNTGLHKFKTDIF